MSAAIQPIKRASRLLAVPPSAAEPSKPKLMAFGAPGVGKSYFALQFPSVYFIDTEGGANRKQYMKLLEQSGGAYLGPREGALSFDTIIDQIQALATEKHHFKTLVIDSVSKLFALEIAREAERLSTEGKKNEFGADKKPAVGYMRRLVSWIHRIDMNVMLIAHEVDVWGKNEKGEREVIGQGPDAWSKLPYELDLSVHIQKRGPSRVARVVKSRLEEFPDASQFPWDFEQFANRYGRDVIYAESKTIELATQEQVSEVNRLMGIVKMPDDWLDRCLSKAGVEKISELDRGAIDKIINTLKERVQ